MTDVAAPLKLGTQHDQPFVLDDHWDRHMARKEGSWRSSVGVDAALTVGIARSWLDEPEAMGLPSELSNLILLVWAAKTNRRVLRHGGPIEERVESLPDDAELRPQAMPTDGEWTAMIDRAGRLFGLVPATRVATAGAVAKLAADVRTRAESARTPLIELIATLGRLDDTWNVGDSSRLQCAQECRDLASAVIASGDDDLALLRAMTATTMTRPVENLARTWGDAGPVLRALMETQWTILESAARLGTVDGDGLASEVRRALSADQLSQPIGPALVALVNAASGLLSRRTPSSSASPDPGAGAPEPRGGTPFADAGPTAAHVASPASPAQRALLPSTIVHADLTIEAAQKVLGSLPPSSGVRVTLRIDGLEDRGGLDGNPAPASDD